MGNLQPALWNLFFFHLWTWFLGFLRGWGVQGEGVFLGNPKDSVWEDFSGTLGNIRNDDRGITTPPLRILLMMVDFSSGLGWWGAKRVLLCFSSEDGDCCIGRCFFSLRSIYTPEISHGYQTWWFGICIFFQTFWVIIHVKFQGGRGVGLWKLWIGGPQKSRSDSTVCSKGIVFWVRKVDSENGFGTRNASKYSFTSYLLCSNWGTFSDF